MDYLTWGAARIGNHWHMWCETPPLEDVEGGSACRATEAGYVEFSATEYPEDRPPDIATILWHVPVLMQQLALKMTAREFKHRALADHYANVRRMVISEQYAEYLRASAELDEE